MRQLSRVKKWRAKRTAGYADSYRRSNRLRTLKAYGLTLGEFEEMVVSQNGKCAICKQPPAAPTGG